ncbi:hypothetical protein V6N12_044519 [Hibiscus sabdariffa]|uniref:Uncharacterized protein n=1 Tax=Hibiscus sabdariffa TaxID=183260 RepID=A0ABR2BN79_9ROSI
MRQTGNLTQTLLKTAFSRFEAEELGGDSTIYGSGIAHDNSGSNLKPTVTHTGNGREAPNGERLDGSTCGAQSEFVRRRWSLR